MLKKEKGKRKKCHSPWNLNTNKVNRIKIELKKERNIMTFLLAMKLTYKKKLKEKALMLLKY